MIPATPDQSSRREQEAFAARAFDERADAEGRVAEAYERFFARFGPNELNAEAERVARHLAAGGVEFRTAEGSARPFLVDVVPRLVAAEEWDLLAAGIAQRVRGLNAFLADAYGERRAVAAGVVPTRILEGAEWFEPALTEWLYGGGPAATEIRAHAIGPDLVRGEDGVLRVLEDNTRAPSGLAYLLAARGELAPLAAACGLEPPALDEVPAVLGRTLRAAVPQRSLAERPLIVLLNDGPGSSAAYEHEALAALLGLRVAAAAELRRRGDRLLLGEDPVDVIYRRVDDERMIAADGTPTELGELLLPALAAGTLGCVNSMGSGVADDKAVHAYVERMIGFYLGEEPLLRSVPSYDLGDPAQRDEALPRIAAGELVVKPRFAFGGKGVAIGPLAAPEELGEVVAAVEADPAAYVAQQPVALSVHPTLLDGKLVGRHVDLRPFAYSGADGVVVSPGGLSRFARVEGEMVVNSGRGGGAKDTWVI